MKKQYKLIIKYDNLSWWLPLTWIDRFTANTLHLNLCNWVEYIAMSFSFNILLGSNWWVVLNLFMYSNSPNKLIHYALDFPVLHLTERTVCILLSALLYIANTTIVCDVKYDLLCLSSYLLLAEKNAYY